MTIGSAFSYKLLSEATHLESLIMDAANDLAVDEYLPRKVLDKELLANAFRWAGFDPTKDGQIAAMCGWGVRVWYGPEYAEEFRGNSVVDKANEGWRKNAL